MHVGKSALFRLCSVFLAELHIRMLLRCRQHGILIAAVTGKDDVAALPHHLVNSSGAVVF